MIKAFLLLFEPVQSWETVARSKRGFVSVFVFFLLPMVLLSSLAEGYGLVHWGKPRLSSGVEFKVEFTPSQALVYEALQSLLYLGVVLIMAKTLKSLGETFHGRHTFTQGFKTIAYGLSPLFVIRLFDAFPSVCPWIPWFGFWFVGVVLSVTVLYQGVPRVMLPDIPHAIGLYLMNALLVVLITGMVRAVTGGYLAGNFKPAEQFVADVAARLPF